MSRSPATLVDLLSGVRDPERVAVIDSVGTLSYGELVDSVGRTAALLRSLGVRHGDRVGVQLETSIRTMVATHAVLHCGAVVVPLDPRAPLRHLDSIVRDCDIRVLMSDASPSVVEQQLGELPGLHVVATADLDRSDATDWSVASEIEPAAPVGVAPDDRAYVIFTSGSTGRPKGIVHTHASALSYARLSAATYELAADDRVVQVAPLHFDQSTFGLYSAPLVGATTLMIAESMLAFPASVGAFIASHRATIWYSVPTLIMRLVQRGGLDTHDLSCLRWVKFGGEVFPSGALATAMQQFPAARFSNVYGPAEVNQCTYFHLDRAPLAGEVTPIGRAWADTEIAIVSAARELVRPGSPGEIVVRSPTAMEGYWNAPELTAASFCHVAAADSTTDAARWYLTGDLGVENADGDIVFLGRVDNQVKVRGNRIEIEAVEAALVELDGVTGAAVVVVAADDGTSRLVAVVEGDGPLDTVALRRGVGASLPASAVPDVIHQLSAVPRTSSGKVDRPAVARHLRTAPT